MGSFLERMVALTSRLIGGLTAILWLAVGGARNVCKQMRESIVLARSFLQLHEAWMADVLGCSLSHRERPPLTRRHVRISDDAHTLLCTGRTTTIHPGERSPLAQGPVAPLPSLRHHRLEKPGAVWVASWVVLAGGSPGLVPH